MGDLNVAPEPIDVYHPDRRVNDPDFHIDARNAYREAVADLFGLRGVRFSRENVYLRDQGRCQYCAESVTRSVATYDHVLPRAQGGRTIWENIVTACGACNAKKGPRTPLEAGMPLRKPPYRPRELPTPEPHRLVLLCA